MSSPIFVSNMAAVGVAINAAALKAMIAAGDVGRNTTVKNLRNVPARTGNPGIVPDTKVKYTMSAPGEYPALATARLRDSIQRRVVGGEVQVGTAVEYGIKLEKESPSKGGRPWLKRSLDEAKPAMLAKIAQRWF